jgi:creatinine amidohydrolase/Fe(II)-dependent formamide hydrolase-like protein
VPPPSLELEHLTWTEVRDAIADGYDTVILVGGSLEGHGSHLPLGTDTIWGREFGLKIAERLGGSLLAPVIPYGPDEGLMAFPGTVHVDLETTGRLLQAICESLLSHGFRRIVVCTSHEGYIAPMATLVERMVWHRRRLVVVSDLTGWFEMVRDTGAAEGITVEQLGAHAGEFETSLMLHIRPGGVRQPLPAGTPLDLRDHPDLFRADLSTVAPDGAAGVPSVADAGRGSRYLDAVVDFVVSAVERADRGTVTAPG